MTFHTFGLNTAMELLCFLHCSCPYYQLIWAAQYFFFTFTLFFVMVSILSYQAKQIFVLWRGFYIISHVVGTEAFYAAFHEGLLRRA